jgi:hypothetical protein
MSIDISTEELLSFPEACEKIPGRPHLATLHRWRLRGVRGVKLESCLVGGRRYTSVQAIERFCAQLNGNPQRKETPSARRRRRQRQIEAADRQNDRAGIC